MSQEPFIPSFSPEDVKLIEADEKQDILVHSSPSSMEAVNQSGMDADAGGTAIADEGEMFCVL